MGRFDYIYIQFRTDNLISRSDLDVNIYNICILSENKQNIYVQ
jgi:hypothetical protein